MSQTVSFILPVKNFQYGLRQRVTTIMDVLCELTREFDLLIVDYGSSDETRDVAMDLVREFPQVDFLARDADSEIYDAIEFGIFRTSGDIVFVHDPRLTLGTSALQNLWRMRDDEDLVMAQSRSNDLKSTEQPSFSSMRSSPSATSIQMIRRCAIPSPPPAPASSSSVERVTRTDLLEDTDKRRLPKLLTRLRRFTNPNQLG